MLISMGSILFIIYVGVRIWLFSREKEWKDLIVFAVISGLACYTLFISFSKRESGSVLESYARVTGPVARRLIFTVFGIEV